MTTPTGGGAHSPEQLDRLLSVTTPRAWMALLALTLLLAGGVSWGIFGSIPVRVHGDCILLRFGGILDLPTVSGGQVTDIRPRPGDLVQRGQTIARIAQPELVEQVLKAREELAHQQEVGAPADTIAQTEKQLQSLRERLDSDSRVISPYRGRVLEVRAQRLGFVTPGTVIFTMELEGADSKNLEPIIYVPATEGKKVQPGMVVQISPVTVKKEDHGYMLGRVIAVSEYPVTAEKMLHTLGNPELVRQLQGIGAPIEVRVDLTPDSSTPSGYQWTSRTGPPMQITPGTLCTGQITLGRRTPLALTMGR